VQQWWLPARAGRCRWPVAEGKTTAAPDAVDAAKTGGSEGTGVDEGFVLQASDDEELAPAAK
jgi:hypothetical protein